MRNQTIRVNFIIQKGKLNKEGKCPIMAQITINREMKYLGTKQFVLPERWDYGKTLGLSRDDKRINLVLEGGNWIDWEDVSTGDCKSDGFEHPFFDEDG